jgi:hypothetical protein
VSTSVKEETDKLSVGLKVSIAATLGPDNYLPELIDLLGYERVVELMMVFGGKSVKIPKLTDLADHVEYASAAMAVIEGKTTEDKVIRERNLHIPRFRKVLDGVTRYIESRKAAKQFISDAVGNAPVFI